MTIAKHIEKELKEIQILANLKHEFELVVLRKEVGLEEAYSLQYNGAFLFYGMDLARTMTYLVAMRSMIELSNIDKR